MKKLLTATAIFLTATSTFAEDKPFNPHSYTIEVIKPIRSFHFKDRNHPAGLKYNENHLASLGLGIRHDESGFGANIIYVNKNSLDNQAWYIQADNMQEVYRNFYIGGSVGMANGYPKKAENRTKTDPVPWIMLQAEYCPTKICLGLGLVPYEGGAFITAIKYKF